MIYNTDMGKKAGTIRLQMRKAIQAAQQYLPADATNRVITYIRQLQNEDGGFRGRSGPSDLYYSTFAVETLKALGARMPLRDLLRFLQSASEPRRLDLVHLASWLRCWTILPQKYRDLTVCDEILESLETFRCGDGGYRTSKDGSYSTVFGCFIALGAYQDLGRSIPDPESVGRFVQTRITSQGGYANEPGMTVGSTPATAAALMVLRQFDVPVESASIEWLRSCCRKDAGFAATQAAPIPDMLSTATAVFALDQYGEALDEIREPCLEFIDSLWQGHGGFAGSWLDNVTDCEYTFYGLLAIGSLTKNSKNR